MRYRVLLICNIPGRKFILGVQILTERQQNKIFSFNHHGNDPVLIGLSPSFSEEPRAIEGPNLANMGGKDPAPSDRAFTT